MRVAGTKGEKYAVGPIELDGWTLDVEEDNKGREAPYADDLDDYSPDKGPGADKDDVSGSPMARALKKEEGWV